MLTDPGIKCLSRIKSFIYFSLFFVSTLKIFDDTWLEKCYHEILW